MRASYISRQIALLDKNKSEIKGVIPAQAGIHKLLIVLRITFFWIPACAGMMC